MTIRRAVASLVLALAATPATAQDETEARVVSFERLNRVYESLIDDLTPVQIGPAEVLLRSPEHALTVSRHEATLRPGADGVLETALELELAGSGRIDADITIGSLESRLSQELTVPRQTLRLEGAIRVRRSTEGYWITTVRMPEAAQVRIESELGTQLFSVCRQMALVLVALDCDAIERAVTLIRAPLPEAGGEYLIALEDVTPEERDAFDRFLIERSGP
ncbi:MAG: hypothetical protein OXG81_02440 [Acidobacteria bacterium]|nr:hypothetical protein [Acidobacteriota bacterium]MCY3969933.1 hypothetical protein [Acidobacteriota bacterium]